ERSGRRQAPTGIPVREARESCRSRFYLGRCHIRRWSGGLDTAWIERVTKRIAKQVEAQHRGADRESGKYRRPRGVAQEIQVATIRDHGTPTRRRWLNPQAEERQRRLGHDRAGDP